MLGGGSDGEDDGFEGEEGEDFGGQDGFESGSDGGDDSDRYLGGLSSDDDEDGSPAAPEVAHFGMSLKRPNPEPASESDEEEEERRPAKKAKGGQQAGKKSKGGVKDLDLASAENLALALLQRKK